MPKLSISLNTKKAYTSSDSVTGHVQLISTKGSSTSSFVISCVCRAQVVVPHTGILLTKVYWESVQEVITTPQTIQTGTHNYPFEFELPGESSALASFAYKRAETQVGIQWVVLAKFAKQGLIQSDEMAEKEFKFFPQYPPSLFDHAGTKTVTFNAQVKSHLPNYQRSLSTLFKSNKVKDRQSVNLQCRLMYYSFGIQLAPFTTGLTIEILSDTSDLVILKQLKIRLVGTSTLHASGYTDEFKFYTDILNVNTKFVLNKGNPFSLKKLSKNELTINKILPGSFKSTFFEQTYVLRVDIVLGSVYNDSYSKSWHIDHPVTLMRRWVLPKTPTGPVGDLSDFLSSSPTDSSSMLAPPDYDHLPEYTPQFDSDLERQYTPDIRNTIY